MSTPKIYSMSFAKIYPLYIAKAERKGRSKSEVDQIIQWLTGYDQAGRRKGGRSRLFDGVNHWPIALDDGGESWREMAVAPDLARARRLQPTCDGR